MKVRNVHSRDLAASPERVGELIDGLGGDDDRLWPVDRWPTTTFELDGPLAVGARSRQGQIRQTVDEYVPGRRLVFRFAPGLGLVGTHGMEVEPLCEHRTRLTHTLECRVQPKMIALYPILIRQHDALVEDMFDRAELVTTGLVGPPRRWPASVRIANAIELQVARRRGTLGAADLAPRRAPTARRDRLTRISAVAIPAALAALAALHAAWALGWRWPGGSDQGLAEHVLSQGERTRLGSGELPPVALTWSVALALLGAAAIVSAVGTGTPSRALRGGAWGVSGILLARGVVYLPSYLDGGLDDTYERLDLAVYSPLCLALGAGAAIVARRASCTSPARHTAQTAVARAITTHEEDR